MEGTNKALQQTTANHAHGAESATSSPIIFELANYKFIRTTTSYYALSFFSSVIDGKVALGLSMTFLKPLTMMHAPFHEDSDFELDLKRLKGKCSFRKVGSFP